MREVRVKGRERGRYKSGGESWREELRVGKAGGERLRVRESGGNG